MSICRLPVRSCRFFFIDSFIAALSWSAYATVLFAGGVTTFLVFWLSGTSKNIIRHASMKSMGRLCFAILLSDILLGGVLFWSDWCLFGHHLFAFCLLDFLVTTVSFKRFSRNAGTGLRLCGFTGCFG